VEGGFGGVRVYDALGERVDEGGALRPDGSGRSIGVALRDDLPEGTYTATYRVVSADSHPVSGGFVFTVGRGGAPPGATVDELIDAGRAGPVTEIAFGIVRGLAYAAMALGLGAVAFLLWAWLPALARAGGPEPHWQAASEGFLGRLRPLAFAAVALGVLTSALGIVLQGATASGTSAWGALDPSVVGAVLDTRFGTVWAARLVAWVLVGIALAAVLSGRRAPVPRPAMGAAGLSPAPVPRPALLAAVAVPLGFVALSAGLGGHAGSQHPVALLLPADTIHVLGMGTWLGGLVVLLAAVPAATRRLPEGERSRLLAGAVGRFSTLALVAVGAILLTGIVQSVVHVRTPANLVETAFGRAVLIKALLFAGLVALAAVNRRRSVPGLRRAAAGGEPPGRAGRTLRRAVRGEVALAVVVLGVTAALVSYAPSVAETAGPASASAVMGPARAEITVDPAAIGRNEVHVYLFDRATGGQYDEIEELALALTLPERDIGPLDLDPRKAGPGHYVVPGAQIGVAGDWVLTLTGRVSEFEEHRARVEVPVR
jgi:copper transport protein